MKMFEQLRFLIRQLKWGRLETNLGLIGFTLLGLGPWLLGLPPVQNLLPDGWDIVTPAWILGAVLVVFSATRLWRLTTPPVDVPSVEGPVVRGAAAFTPKDGELFRRLGRQEELRKLHDWIHDDQVPMVIVMGASGVGKTSLLRAGVQNLEDLDVAYWEAVATEPAERLKKAIEAQLDDPSRGVLLIDQGEQLGQDREVFELLRTHLESDPPYGLTWILAIRREYLPDWTDWSQTELDKQARQRVEILPVLPLSRERGKEVFSILADEVRLVVREEVRAEVIRSIAEGNRVSPVDLAIALQVLTRNPKHAEDPRFFLAIGGHSAMLTSYLEGELEVYDEATRGEICRALLELIDLENDRRNAEGKTVAALEEIAHPVSSTVFAHAIERLALPTVRVLEHVGEGRLRLIHERFIPAVRRLAGTVLTSAERVSRLLAQRSALWLREGEEGRFLLTSRELAAIERELPRLNWGKDRTLRERFLARSARKRRIHRGLALASLAVGLFASVWGYQWWQAKEIRNQLTVWKLPLGFYDVLPQLKTLKLSQVVENLIWLEDAGQLEHLSLHGQRLKSLRGIPKSLTQLNLDLSNSQVSTLPELAHSLTQLTVNLHNSQVSTLPELPKSLTQLNLKLTGSQVSSLPEFPQALTQLTLELAGSQVSSLPKLPESLTELTLTLNGSQVSTLAELPQSLTQLNLTLFGSQAPALATLPQSLTQLNLTFSNSQVPVLATLPQSLTHLTLTFRMTQFSTFPILPDNLTQLILNLNYAQLSNLPALPQSLTQLSLDLSGLKVSSLPALPQNLTQLSLNLSNSEVSALPEFPQNLTELTLVTGSQISTLPELPDSLTELSLDLSGSQFSTLSELPESLTKLSLDFGRSPVSTFPNLPQKLTELSLDFGGSPGLPLPDLPRSLTVLRLDLSNSPMGIRVAAPPRDIQRNLDPRGLEVSILAGLPLSLTELSLDLSNSRVSTLPDLPQSVTKLTLNLSRSQVSILPDLPGSVTELTLDLQYSLIGSVEGLPSRATLNLSL